MAGVASDAVQRARPFRVDFGDHPHHVARFFLERRFLGGVFRIVTMRAVFPERHDLGIHLRDQRGFADVFGHDLQVLEVGARGSPRQKQHRAKQRKQNEATNAVEGQTRHK